MTFVKCSSDTPVRLVEKDVPVHLIDGSSLYLCLRSVNELFSSLPAPLFSYIETLFSEVRMLHTCFL